MRVGYIVRYWPALTETFIVREVQALRARGIEVDVVAMGSRDGTAPAFRPPRWSRPLQLHRTAPVKRVGRWQSFKASLDCAWATSLAAERNWDRVHAHFLGEAAEWAWAISVQLGIPYTVTAHAVDVHVPRLSVQTLAMECETLVAVSQLAASWLLAATGARAQVIHCGVEPGPQARPAKQPPSVVCVAGNREKKGIPDLIAALAPLGVPLRLVSSAPAPSWVDAGPLLAHQVAAELAKHQLFVLPSRVLPSGDREGIPVALMEAMAAGLPVITTRSGGIAELVDDQVGWLVGPADPEGLRAALDRALSAPVLRQRRGRTARERVLRGDWRLERQVAGLLRCWAQSDTPP